MGQQGSKHDEGEGAVDKYEASLIVRPQAL
jgi:hypothetical protein